MVNRGRSLPLPWICGQCRSFATIQVIWRRAILGLAHADAHRLRLQVVAPGDSAGLPAGIEAELRRALPGEVVLQVECVETIPRAPGEKIRMVISRCSAAKEGDSWQPR